MKKQSSSSKHKSSKRRDGGGGGSGGGGISGGGGESAWSEWTWSQPYQKYYRSRQLSNGDWDYLWQETQTTTQQNDAVPRPAGIEAITEGMANLSTSTSNYGNSYGYNQGSQAASTYSYQPQVNHGEETAYSYPPGQAGKSGRSKKGKHVAYSEQQNLEPEPQPEPQPSGPSAPPLDPFWGANAQSSEAPQASSSYNPASVQNMNQEPLSSASNTEAPNYGSGPHGSGSSSGYGYGNSSGHGHSYEYGEPSSVGASSNAAASTNAAAYGYGTSSPYGYQPSGHPAYQPAYEPAYPPQDSHGGSFPQEAADEPSRISGADMDVEALDPRYKIEHSSRFQPGSIFKVLRAELIHGHPASERSIFKGPYGENFYAGPRRYIVVASDHGQSTCVPILTYNDKGCKKSGVRPKQHGIIVERGHKSRLLHGEPTLGYDPVRAKLNDGEKLASSSRVNYAKLETIEHNTKVFFIGHVIKEDAAYVKQAVDHCWEQKMHGQQ